MTVSDGPGASGPPPNQSEEEFPAGASPSLRKQIVALQTVTTRLRTIIREYYLFSKLARDKSFVDSVNGTEATPGLRVIVHALIGDMIIKIASLYDNDQRATDVRRILNALTDPVNRDVLSQYHQSFVVLFDTERETSRLSQHRERLRRRRLQAAIGRIIDLRKQVFAHSDLNPQFPSGPAMVRDIQHVLAATAIVIRDANAYAGNGATDLEGMKRVSRSAATAFANVVVHGLDQGMSR